ncbi:hypothetical protein [Bradyrhizobium sp. I1.14.4]|uniref:hypothetical protein n=1 Tax=unclassified Bradyrhizobium TaxID=2631580 RepID=UPI003D216AA2
MHKLVRGKRIFAWTTGDSGNYEIVIAVFALYVVGSILTFGIFYRNRQVSIGPKQIISAFAWPIWWPLANGFGGVIDAIDSMATATEARKSVSFSSGLLRQAAVLPSPRSPQRVQRCFFLHLVSSI